MKTGNVQLADSLAGIANQAFEPLGITREKALCPAHLPGTGIASLTMRGQDARTASATP
jgi:hypothetical protein